MYDKATFSKTYKEGMKSKKMVNDFFAEEIRKSEQELANSEDGKIFIIS